MYITYLYVRTHARTHATHLHLMYKFVRKTACVFVRREKERERE